MDKEIIKAIDPWAQHFDELYKLLSPHGATTDTMQSGKKTKNMILNNLNLFEDKKRTISLFKHLFPEEKINA